MRERTLHHLLLLTGKAISDANPTSGIQLSIRNICETLQIEKRRGSPYVLRWEIDGRNREHEVRAERFRFHERGDVVRSNSNEPKMDLRKSNWDQAVKVWSEILECLFVYPDSLAPAKKSSLSLDRVRKSTLTFLISTVVVVLAFQTNFLWAIVLITAIWIPLTNPTRMGTVIEGLCLLCLYWARYPNTNILSNLAILLVFNIGNTFFRQKSHLGILTALFTFAIIGEISMPQFLTVVTLEIVSTHLGSLKRYTFAYMLILLATPVLPLSDYNLEIGEIWEVGLLFGSLSAICLAYLPRSSEVGLARVSVPIALALSVMSSSRQLEYAIVICVGWLMPLLRLPKSFGNYSKSGRRSNGEFQSVKVSVRRRT